MPLSHGSVLSAAGVRISLCLYAALVPAALLSIFSAPALASSQRGSRVYRWGSPHGIASGVESAPSGTDALWTETRPVWVTSTGSQGSTQQFDRTWPSSPPSAPHNSSFSYNSQQGRQTTPPSPTFANYPAMPTRLSSSVGINNDSVRGAAHSSHLPDYSARGGMTSTGGTRGATGTGTAEPRSADGAPQNSVVSINRFSATPASQQFSTTDSSMRGTLISQPTSAIFPSLPLVHSSGYSQPTYSAYTGPIVAPDRMTERPAGPLMSSTNVPFPGSNTRLQSNPPATSFTSEISPNWSTTSPSSSYVSVPSVTSAVNPWGSAAQQHSENPVGAVNESRASRISTNLPVVNSTGAINSERQWAVSGRQSIPLPTNQRPWTTDSSSNTHHSSENVSFSASNEVLHDRPPQNMSTANYQLPHGFDRSQTASSQRPSVVSSRPAVHIETRNSTAFTSQAMAGEEGGGRRFGVPVALPGPRSNTMDSASVGRNFSSSVWSPDENPYNRTASTTSPNTNSSFSLEPPSRPQWSAASNPSFLQHENRLGPSSSPQGNNYSGVLANTLPGHSKTDSRESTLPTDESQSDSSGEGRRTSTPFDPCQRLHDENASVVQADGSEGNRCGELGRHETSTASLRVPFLPQETSSASGQRGTTLRPGKRSADTPENRSSLYTASYISSDSSSSTARRDDLVNKPVVRDASDSENMGGELDSLSSNNPHPQSTQAGIADGVVDHNVDDDPKTGDGATVEPQRNNAATKRGEVLNDSSPPENAASDHLLAGYIPPDALASLSVERNKGEQENAGGQPLYGELRDYMTDAEDPFLESVVALERKEDEDVSTVTTTSTTTQTYPPFYNPYNDNLDVDDIPDSPYHNYKWAVDPFPSTYSTHSRLENYESEFNNRYYHEERTAPNITWEEYTRRRREVDDARKREAELQNGSRIGLIDGSDSQFQGLIGYPNRGRMSRSRL